MGFLQDMRRLADQARASASEATGIRTNQLTIRTRTWAGGRPGEDGGYTDVDLALPARYPVRHLNSQEINSAAGSYEIGDILVDHITPSDGAGVGYTPEQLSPEVTTDDIEVIYVITGDHAGEYALVECRTYRPFTYQLVLRRSARTP